MFTSHTGGEDEGEPTARSISWVLFSMSVMLREKAAKRVHNE